MNEAPMLSDDVRLELLNAAGASERAGRPVGLVVLAGLALAAAVGYAAYGMVVRGGAASRRDEAAEELATIKREADALLTLDAQRKVDDQKFTRSDVTQPRVETLAQDSGMNKPVITLRTVTTNFPGLTRVELTASLDDQLTGPVLEWLSGLNQIDNLAVSSIELVPDLQLAPGTEEGRPRWRGSVTMFRYQRQ